MMKKKILIVEDDPTSAKLVEFLLKTNDYDPFVAYDGEEGVKKFQKNQPDLIVLDIQLPKMDGYTFLQKIKSLGQNIPPVIMLTSRDQMKDLFQMEGIAAYFVKPLPTEPFLAKVKECLNMS